jgi:hypothetical protein
LTCWDWNDRYATRISARVGVIIKLAISASDAIAQSSTTSRSRRAIRASSVRRLPSARAIKPSLETTGWSGCKGGEIHRGRPSRPGHKPENSCRSRPSWKASDYADFGYSPSPATPLLSAYSRHNPGVGMLPQMIDREVRNTSPSQRRAPCGLECGDVRSKRVLFRRGKEVLGASCLFRVLSTLAEPARSSACRRLRWVSWSHRYKPRSFEVDLRFFIGISSL